MKYLFFCVLFIFGASLMSAQVSSSKSKTTLTPTKKYTKVAVVQKKESSGKMQSTLKRTVKIVREDKKSVDLSEW